MKSQWHHKVDADIFLAIRDFYFEILITVFDWSITKHVTGRRAGTKEEQIEKIALETYKLWRFAYVKIYEYF